MVFGMARVTALSTLLTSSRFWAILFVAVPRPVSVCQLNLPVEINTRIPSSWAGRLSATLMMVASTFPVRSEIGRFGPVPTGMIFTSFTGSSPRCVSASRASKSAADPKRDYSDDFIFQIAGHFDFGCRHQAEIRTIEKTHDDLYRKPHSKKLEMQIHFIPNSLLISRWTLKSKTLEAGTGWANPSVLASCFSKVSTSVSVRMPLAVKPNCDMR